MEITESGSSEGSPQSIVTQEQLGGFLNEAQVLLNRVPFQLKQEDRGNETIVRECVYIADVTNVLDNFDTIRSEIDRLVLEVKNEQPNSQLVRDVITQISQEYFGFRFVANFFDESDNDIRHVVVERTGFDNNSLQKLAHLIHALKEINNVVKVKPICSSIPEIKQASDVLSIEHFKKWLDKRTSEYHEIFNPKRLSLFYDILFPQILKIHEKLTAQQDIQEELRLLCTTMSVEPEGLAREFLSENIENLLTKAEDEKLEASDINNMRKLHQWLTPLKDDFTSVHRRKLGRENSWTRFDHGFSYDIKNHIPRVNLSVFSGSRKIFYTFDDVDDVFKLGVNIATLAGAALEHCNNEGLNVHHGVLEGIKDTVKTLKTVVEKVESIVGELEES